MIGLQDVTGAWSEEEKAWVSNIWQLTGDCWLEVKMPGKSRLVIKKAEKREGPWPKCLKSTWTGPDYRIRIYGSTKYRYVQFFLTEAPERIQIANTRGYALELPEEQEQEP